ncbi:MAG: acetyl-coenzyme A synthetase N-terminal domain-containing protein [Flavobacteriales bacterium]
MLKINSLEQYQSDYKRSVENPELFWESIAESFEWKKKWDKVLDWNFDEPNVKWFDGGQLNITENCLDRHLDSIGDKVAFHWVPNDVSEKGRKISYRELHAEVCKFSNVLSRNGVKKGDRVCLYMPMVPELVIACRL